MAPRKGHKFASRKMLHGATKGGRSRTYRTWASMLERCYSPNATGYQHWGGRGIRVHEEWRASFATFLADVGERPPGMTLDRYPNKDGHYEPGNVRWANDVQQASNRRNNVCLTLNGETLTLREWSRRLDCNQSSLRMRRLKGWSDERILTTPFRYHGPRVVKHKNEGVSHACK